MLSSAARLQTRKGRRALPKKQIVALLFNHPPFIMFWFQGCSEILGQKALYMNIVMRLEGLWAKQNHFITRELERLVAQYSHHMENAFFPFSTHHRHHHHPASTTHTHSLSIYRQIFFNNSNWKMGHLGGSVHRTSKPWFRLRSWSQGPEIEPRLWLQSPHSLLGILSLPLSPFSIVSLSLSKINKWIFFFLKKKGTILHFDKRNHFLSVLSTR